MTQVDLNGYQTNSSEGAEGCRPIFGKGQERIRKEMGKRCHVSRLLHLPIDLAASTESFEGLVGKLKAIEPDIAKAKKVRDAAKKTGGLTAALAEYE